MSHAGNTPSHEGHNSDALIPGSYDTQDNPIDPSGIVEAYQDTLPGLAQGAPRKQPRRRHGTSKQSDGGQPMTVADEPILLTRKQAAELLQIGLTTLDKWSREPDFPIIRGHRLARIPKDELVEWVKRFTARRSGNFGYRPDLTPPRRRR